MLDETPPEAATYLSAALCCLIVRSADINILAKGETQRTQPEKRKVKRGLGRSVALELCVFVPATATLALLVEPLLLPAEWKSDRVPQATAFAILGLLSYGFPLAAVRRIVRKIALQTLKEFSEITYETEEKGP